MATNDETDASMGIDSNDEVDAGNNFEINRTYCGARASDQVGAGPEEYPKIPSGTRTMLVEDKKSKNVAVSRAEPTTRDAEHRPGGDHNDAETIQRVNLGQTSSAHVATTPQSSEMQDVMQLMSERGCFRVEVIESTEIRTYTAETYSDLQRTRRTKPPRIATVITGQQHANLVRNFDPEELQHELRKRVADK